MLLLEDGTGSGTVLAGLLRSAGYTLEVCGSARDALAAVLGGRTRFEAVVIDWTDPAREVTGLLDDLARESPVRGRRRQSPGRGAERVR